MKKLCSIFLVLTLLFTISPMIPAFADVTAVQTGDIVLVDEDFSEGFELDKAYTGAEMEELSDLNFVSNMPVNHWPDKTNAYFTVKQKKADDSTKGNYLEIGPQKDDSHAIVMADFDDVKTGTLVTEMKIRPSVGRRTKYYNAMVGADGSSKRTLYGVNGSDTVVWSYGVFPSWNVQLTPGSDDFCSVKTVWYREKETDNWSVDLYDMVLNRKLLSYTTGGEDTLDSNFTPSGVMFYNNWQVAADAEISVDIADLKAYIPAEVTLTKASDYVHSKKTISFTTSKALDAATVNSETVKVKSTDGTEIPATASYANGVVTVKTDSFLKEGGSFVATLNGAKTTEGYAVYDSECAFDIAKAGQIVLVEEDFSEGFELGTAYTGAQMEEFSDLNFVSDMPANHWPDKTNAYLTVKPIDADDSTKGNYLEIGGDTAEGRHAIVMADFEDIKTGTLVTEMKIRVRPGGRQKDYNALVGVDDSVKITAFSTNAGDDGTKIWPGGIFPKWGEVFATDSNDFISIKTVWYRANETDNWSVDIYDMISGRKLYSYTGTGTDLTVDSTFVPTKIIFFKALQYPAWSHEPVDLADLKVYIPAEVTLEEKDEYNSSTKSVSFNVSEDLVASTVTSETVILTDDAGDVVAATPSYADGVLTLTTTSILAKGEYTVTLNGVKTVSDGIELNGVACTFVADVKGDIILVDEDFSTGFELGRAYTGAQMEALSELDFISNLPANHWPDKDNAYFMVKAIDEEDSTKGNYLEVSHHANDKHALIMGDFEDITKGTLVTEMKVRVHEGFRTKYFNGLIGTDQTVKYTGYSTSDDVWSGGLFPTWNKTFTKDTDGFVSIKAVWYRANTTDNWSIDLYDMVLGQKVLSYTGEGDVTQVDSSFVPTGAMFFNSWQVAANAEVSMDFAALKVYIPAEISLEQKGEYNFAKNTISFTPSAELLAATVTQETVTLKDENGTSVAITPTYANGALTIKTAKRIANGKYTVTVNGVKAADGRTLNNVIYTFTINVTGNIILVDEDFSEGFELGTAYTGAQMENLTDLQFTTAGIKDTYPDRESAYLTVKAIDSADASKGNYLEIGDHLDGKNALVAADFEDVTEGTLVTEMKIRSYGNATKHRPKNYNGLLNAEGDWKSTAYGSDMNADATKVWSGGIFSKWSITFTKDTDGFNHVKAVWYRAKATDNWSVDLYDMFLGQKVLSYTGAGTDQTIDSSFVPSGAMFINAYKDATWADEVIDIAALKAYIVPVNQNYAVENIVCTSADAEIEAITSSMTEVAVKADVYTKAANESFTAVLAIYNGERLAAVQSFDGVSNAAGVCEVSLELTGLDLIDGATAKLFLWDGITSMKPLLGATEVLPKAGF